MMRGILEFYIDLWNLFLDFIGFLFDIDFRNKNEKEKENPFANVPELPVVSNEIHREIKTDDLSSLEKAIGKNAANYIEKMREEVDFLVNEHELKYVDSILAVIPPQKLDETNLSSTVIENIIESIYNQYNEDVILRPGKINMFVNNGGEKIAEIYIDCYKPSEELINR